MLELKTNPSALWRNIRIEQPKHRTALPHLTPCLGSVNFADCRFDKIVLFVCFLRPLQRGVQPSEAPFIVEDMPHLHRFVYDFYSQYVQSLRAQQQVTMMTTFYSYFSFNRAAPKVCNRNLAKCSHKIVSVLRSGLDLACGRGFCREPPFRASSSPTVRRRIRYRSM